MNIGFEAKRFFTNYTGLGNYCRFVVDALSTFQPENTYLLYTPKNIAHPETDVITHRPNVKVISPKGIYSQPGFSALWRSWGMSKESSVENLSVFHGLSQELPVGLPREVKKVLTVHDLIFLRYPQFYNPVDVRIYHRKVRSACEQADRIVAISHQTADDIVRFIGKEFSEKIRIVYQGCHPIFSRKIDETVLAKVKSKYELPDRFILNVGTIEERKNLIVLIRALSELNEKNRLPIIAVGRPTQYMQDVKREIEILGLQRWVKFLYLVVFEDLPAIYRQATLFVYPSLFEGFGIPLVEALSSRVPVITSTGSCFHEAAGESAVYVDPKDHMTLGREIRRVLSSDSLQREMIGKGTSFIERFEPQHIARNMMEVYREVLAS